MMRATLQMTAGPRGTRDASAARHSLVVGLGKTGLSCARFLARRGESVAVTDTRACPPALDALREAVPGVRLRLQGLDTGLLNDAGRVIVSPGVALEEPLVVEARRRGIPVIGDIDLFVHEARAPVVAVTGSNGKSTVTTMIAAMIARAGYEVRAGGNLGTPALDLLGESEPDYYVLELSSFQLERTGSLGAMSAVVLNITPDHLDRHGGVSGYQAAKAAIFRGCERPVVNRDDPRVLSLCPAATAVTSFGLDAPEEGDLGLVATADDQHPWLARGNTRLMAAADVPLPGRHNIANALAALALGSALGLPDDAMVGALRDFEGLPHRMQRVGRHRGVTWLNDSKATNVAAAVAAIEGLDGPLVWIGGGDGKGADFTPLRGALSGKLTAAILVGADASRLEASLQGLGELRRADNMEQAVALASELAEPGDIVLLSPACASLDMYASYEERGDLFAAAVGRLAS